MNPRLRSRSIIARLRLERCEDRTLPAAPVILGVSDDTGFAGDRVTRDNTLVLFGTADLGAVVDVRRDGAMLGTITADGTGHWSLDRTAEVLADARYVFTATSKGSSSLPFDVNVRATVPATIVTHDDTIPNFGSETQTASRHVWVSSGLGRWADQFANAGPADVVIVQHDVTFDGAADVYTVVIESGGALRFASDVDTSMKVVNFEVLDGGLLEVGSEVSPVSASAVITFKDVPLDTVRDPSQFGNGLIAFGSVHMHGRDLADTFVRLATEPLAGQNTLTLSTPVSGWRIGDRIALPDTHQLDWFEQHNYFSDYQPQWETFTINAIDGQTLTLDHSMEFDHLGAHDPDGTLRFLPHVALLSRNVVVRSANSLGTRGHTLFTHRADVDIRDVQFSGLGRTTNANFDNTTFKGNGSVEHLGTNQQGRYPVHFHHLMGPVATPADGYQFTFVNNAVFCMMNAFTFRWGLTVHDSHYGLIEGNVVYNWAGSGILTETGNEIGNVFQNNLVSRISGTGERSNNGQDGVGFWFHGPDNIVRDNVASNVFSPGPFSYGFSISPEYVGEQMQPAFPGANPHMPGEGVMRDMNGTPVREFTRNEAYGATSGGLTLWWLGAFGATTDEWIRGNAGTVSDFVCWNVYGIGVFIYPTNGLRLERFTAVADTHRIEPDNYAFEGITFSDYEQKGLVIVDADIRGFAVGIAAPPFSRGETRIEGGYLQNTVDISASTMWSVHGGADLPAKRLVIDGTRFDLLAGNRFTDPFTIQMDYRADYGSNLIQSDEVLVYNYDGEAGKNFRLYYKQQRHNFMVPRTGSNLLPGDSSWPLIGSPVAGLTNQQNWLQYGIAIGGAIAPAGPLLDLPEVDGIAISPNAPPPLDPPVIVGISDDTGVPGDFITADRTLTLRGIAEPGTFVSLFRGAASVATALANAVGNWSAKVPGFLPDGRHSFTAIASIDDRVSDRSAAREVEIRSRPPVAPIITGFSNDTGAADGITADNRPTLRGTSTPGVTVEVRRNGVILIQVQANHLGEWSFAPPAALADGRYQFTARTLDLATGLFSALSRTLTITIDTAVPPAPQIFGPSGLAAQPTFWWRSWRIAARYEIELTNLTTGEILTFSLASTTFRPTKPLPKASYQIRVRGVSRAGVAGDFSVARQFNV